MAPTALQAMKSQRRLMALQARRIKATKLVAETQRPWWAPLASEAPRFLRTMPQVPDIDCHQMLGATRGASPTELKDAFLAKARQHDPLMDVQQDRTNFVVARMCYEFLAASQRSEEGRRSPQMPLADVDDLHDGPFQRWSGLQSTRAFFGSLMPKVGATSASQQQTDAPPSDCRCFDAALM
eukprot:CAMPEP_0181460004 /NCGR_PEP_ID=MMETSP1110-20121109/33117_1 /TAXON_ID=174948 /ORGANISM="Symbiodinium sp., Strain CCMP421" /LENGTH=181 /DNA_ID=CAMNT_0023584541 /DNA_START=53 /DNA_END=599 /DNA_ORIENTATION=-